MEIIRSHFAPIFVGLLLATVSVGAWTSWAVSTHSWPFCGGSFVDGSSAPMSIQNLTQASDRVIIGSVGHIGPSWQQNNGYIVTNVTVSTTESLKPQGGAEQIEIIVAGGTIGCYTERVSNAPSFASDEQVLLFLTTGPDGYTRVTGGIIGKYTISNGYAYPTSQSGAILLSDLISEIRRYV